MLRGVRHLVNHKARHSRPGLCSELLRHVALVRKPTTQSHRLALTGCMSDVTPPPNRGSGLGCSLKCVDSSAFASSARGLAGFYSRWLVCACTRCKPGPALAAASKVPCVLPQSGGDTTARVQLAYLYRLQRLGPSDVAPLTILSQTCLASPWRALHSALPGRNPDKVNDQ